MQQKIVKTLGRDTAKDRQLNSGVQKKGGSRRKSSVEETLDKHPVHRLQKLLLNVQKQTTPRCPNSGRRFGSQKILLLENGSQRLLVGSVRKNTFNGGNLRTNSSKQKGRKKKSNKHEVPRTLEEYKELRKLRGQAKTRRFHPISGKAVNNHKNSYGGTRGTLDLGAITIES